MRIEGTRLDLLKGVLEPKKPKKRRNYLMAVVSGFMAVLSVVMLRRRYTHISLFSDE